MGYMTVCSYTKLTQSVLESSGARELEVAYGYTGEGASGHVLQQGEVGREGFIAVHSQYQQGMRWIEIRRRTELTRSPRRRPALHLAGPWRPQLPMLRRRAWSRGPPGWRLGGVSGQLRLGRGRDQVLPEGEPATRRWRGRQQNSRSRCGRSR